MRNAIEKTFTASLASPVASPPAPLVPLSNAPTSFYRQHHAVEAPAINEREFRPAWRIKTRLVLLMEAGRIDRRQLEAAMSFKGWCEAIGRQRTSAWLAVRVDGGRRPEGFLAVHQIDAAHHLHDADRALGRARTRLLIAAIVDDAPWSRIAGRLGVSSKTASCRAIEAIAALALWRSGQPVPPAPVNRMRIEPGRW